MLDAGIDVFSTVNVQHLESLNDQVCELTGIRVRETIPDAVLGTADDVVLIDITPESLIERLRRRQGLPGRARPGGARQLLQDREPLGAARGRAAPGRRGGRGQARGFDRRPGAAARERLIEVAAPQAIGERLLALVTAAAASPSASCAARGARRSGSAPSSTCCGSPTTSRPTQEQEQLEALRRLASVLGAHLLVEHGDDVALVAQRVARERGTTYVLMGTPSARGALRAADVALAADAAAARCCRASTCGSSPTAPSAPESEPR